MASPDRFQSIAMARIAQNFGWARVGLVYATDDAGIALKTGFETECALLGIAVVATVAVPTGLDWTSNVGEAMIGDIAESLSLRFSRENVRTYYLAVPKLEDLYVALSAANVSGVIGPEYNIMAPSFSVAVPWTPTTAAFQTLLNGAVGVFPDVNETSASADLMWDAWPKNDANWTALLETSPVSLEQRATLLPDLNRDDIGLFSHVTWDATFFAAKAIAASFESCSANAPGTDQHTGIDRLDIACVTSAIRATEINGTTGEVRLDAAGDRFGAYGVFNGVFNESKHRWVRVGLIQDFVIADSVEIDIPAMVWSDGTSGRTTGPQGGQQTHPPTQAPVVDQPSGESGDDTLLVATIAVLFTALVLVGIAFAVRTEHIRRATGRPADFRKVWAYAIS
jgi:hypothetical protein